MNRTVGIIIGVVVVILCVCLCVGGVGAYYVIQQGGTTLSGIPGLPQPTATAYPRPRVPTTATPRPGTTAVAPGATPVLTGTVRAAATAAASVVGGINRPGVRQNPYPRNSAGLTINGDFTLAVIESVPDATDRVRTANASNPAPAAGNQYALVKVRVILIRPAGTAAVRVGPGDFQALTNTDKIVPAKPVQLPQRLDGPVNPAAVVDGDIVFELPRGETIKAIVFQATDPARDGTWFAVS